MLLFGVQKEGLRRRVEDRGNIGIMENKMETTIMENQMEKKMENEMETGIIQGIYWDNGKENGNYYLGFYVHRLRIRFGV